MLPSLAQQPAPQMRRALRYFAAAIAACCAIVYFAIGASLIHPPKGQEGFLLFFGVSTGLMFALGAVLLVWTDRRAVLVLGALFQAFVIVGYFQVSGQRDPHFEIWGLSLKVAQSIILVALVVLLRPFRR